MKSLKDATDKEIIALFLQTLQGIRQTEDQYGKIIVEVSGGKVKFITVEVPVGKIR